MCLLTLFTITLFIYSCSKCCCCTKRSKKFRYNSIDDDKTRLRVKESCLWKLFCFCCRKRFLNKKLSSNNNIESNELQSSKQKEFKYSLLENKDDSFQFSGKNLH